MDGFIFLDILIAVLALCLIRGYLTLCLQNMPPGPTPLPIIGNWFDMPKSHDWLHWAKHKDLHGPISSVTVFGQNIVIVNDVRIAIDLLEKKSPVYSGRPACVFAGEMCGWGNMTTQLGYGEQLRAQRKNFQQVIGSKRAVSRFFPMVEVETRRLLVRIADNPDKLHSHIQMMAGAIILKLSYGYTIQPEDRDALVDLANEAVEQGSKALVPMRKLPEWLPGMKFKMIAHQWRKTLTELAEKPYAFVKHKMASGTALPSYTSALLEQAVTTEEEDIVKWSAASLYAAGSDTTVAVIYSFYLAMTVYPEIQKKAQAELDIITGGDRLPTFRDRPQLPYVEAVVKEVLRWHPVTPLGIPHVNDEDDIYNGYFIPKGTVVVPNVWQMTQDPDNFHQPMEFKPERFLSVEDCSPEMDPRKFIFGFGRRICSGKELAESSIFITIAMTLAVFNIFKSRDDNGAEVEPLNEVTSGIISHTKEFECRITPRSSKAAALIRSVNEEHPLTKGDADVLVNLDWEPK